jgi:hypothetical protein
MRDGEIVRGTTPTIRYTFSTINIGDIAVAKLILRQASTVVISKELEDSTAGDSYIEWKLTQEDTLSLTDGTYVKISLDWLLNDGTRGVGNSITVYISSSAINEVINE